MKPGLTIEISFCIFDIQRITERQNKVVITDRMWARLLASTNQPSFQDAKDVAEVKEEEEESQTQLLEGANSRDDKPLTNSH